MGAQSPWAIPSAAPARNSLRQSCANLSAAMSATAWSPCASAAEWAQQESSSASRNFLYRRRPAGSCLSAKPEPQASAPFRANAAPGFRGLCVPLLAGTLASTSFLSSPLHRHHQRDRRIAHPCVDLHDYRIRLRLRINESHAHRSATALDVAREDKLVRFPFSPARETPRRIRAKHVADIFLIRGIPGENLGARTSGHCARFLEVRNNRLATRPGGRAVGASTGSAIRHHPRFFVGFRVLPFPDQKTQFLQFWRKIGRAHV